MVERLPLTCPDCGYDLRGLPGTHTCPECGFRYQRKAAFFLEDLAAERLAAANEIILVSLAAITLVAAPGVLSALGLGDHRLLDIALLAVLAISKVRSSGPMRLLMAALYGPVAIILSLLGIPSAALAGVLLALLAVGLYRQRAALRNWFRTGGIGIFARADLRLLVASVCLSIAVCALLARVALGEPRG